MLGLGATKGDIAVRRDVGKNFILSDNDPTILSNWIELATPGIPVTKVAGMIGDVTLESGQ